MTVGRVIAIAVIFLCGAGGWFVLGDASDTRSSASQFSLGRSVHALWGAPLTQLAPSVTARTPGSDALRYLPPTANRVQAEIELEHRRKGLLWFSTYGVKFNAQYVLTNAGPVREQVNFAFALPDPAGTYLGLRLAVDGESRALRRDPGRGLMARIELDPGASRTVAVSYSTRGMNEWRYRPGSGSSSVRGLELRVDTNFSAVDFAPDSLSPMRQDTSEGSASLVWEAPELLTARDIAIVMPTRLNPGPVAARMSYFAPVGLLFFFVLVTAIAVLRRINVHPMHYLFVTAGFFAFHLLFAYLVDVFVIWIAFTASAVVSVFLVSVYLALSLGPRYPWFAGSIGQMFYLVLFSYSFFLDGATGLTVAIGAVLTLAVLMLLTVRVDWNAVMTTARSQPDDVLNDMTLDIDLSVPDGG